MLRTTVMGTNTVRSSKALHKENLKKQEEYAVPTVNKDRTETVQVNQDGTEECFEMSANSYEMFLSAVQDLKEGYVSKPIRFLPD